MRYAIEKRLRKLLSWLLPFGDKCDPRCDDDLHNMYCMIFPVMFFVITLALIAVLREIFSLDFLERHSLDYQRAMVISLCLLWFFFGATWKLQRNFIIRLWCRKCLRASNPVCPKCGGRIETENHIPHHFLFLSVCDGRIQKCVECGYRRKI